MRLGCWGCWVDLRDWVKRRGQTKHERTREQIKHELRAGGKGAMSYIFRTCACGH